MSGPRPLLVDLFCKAGGAGMGYHRAGFDVLGIDIEPQPNYPFRFEQADAIDWLREEAKLPASARAEVYHASPPCQAFTRARKLQGNVHRDLIAPVRALFRAMNATYVIENVEGAPLVAPVLLCGAMFGLRTYRHRLFESNVPLVAPVHPPHKAKTTKMGRPPRDGEFIHIVGHFSGVPQARLAMGIDWMGQDDLREAIPPSYTEHLGKQLLAHLAQQSAA